MVRNLKGYLVERPLLMTQFEQDEKIDYTEN